MTLTKVLTVFSFGLGVFFAGCRGDANKEVIKYGEPVGIRLPGSAGLPGYEIAVVVSEGTDMAPLVTELAGAIHTAVKACQDGARPGDPEQVLQISFSVEQGAIRGATGKGPGESCISRALEGKPLAVQDKLDVLFQLRPISIADGGEDAP